MPIAAAGIAFDRSASAKMKVGDFEGDALEVALGGIDDRAARLGGAGEGDLVDIHVAGQRRAGGAAEASDNVDHAFGEAGFQRQLTQPNGGERRLLGGLEHDGAAGGQRGPELAAGHRQREVPRHDLAGHADGLAQHVAQPFAGGGDLVGFALQLGRPAGLIAQLADRAADIHHAAELDRAAHVQRLDQRELVAIRFDQVGELVDEAGTLIGLHLGPRTLESGARGGNGGIDVGLTGAGDVGQRLACCRVIGGEGLAALRLSPLAADQHLGRSGGPAGAEGVHAVLDRSLVGHGKVFRCLLIVSCPGIEGTKAARQTVCGHNDRERDTARRVRLRHHRRRIGGIGAGCAPH
jgi:hypothetical protein